MSVLRIDGSAGQVNTARRLAEGVAGLLGIELPVSLRMVGGGASWHVTVPFYAPVHWSQLRANVVLGVFRLTCRVLSFRASVSLPARPAHGAIVCKGNS